MIRAASHADSPVNACAGPPNAAMDKEEFPAPPDSKVAQSRKTTL